MNRIIGIELYHRDILFCFGTKKELRKALLKYHSQEKVNALLNDTDIGSNAKGRTVYDDINGAFFVWMPDIPKTAQDVGFLVHELFHATCAVMAKIGVVPSDDSEEAYAYLIGYLTEKVIDTFNITISCGQEPVSEQTPLTDECT